MNIIVVLGDYILIVKNRGVDNDYFNYSLTMGTSDWYNIVLTYDGTNVEGYVNGESVGTVASSGNGTTDNADKLTLFSCFDANNGNPNIFASILQDETKIYAGALSADWIKADYLIQNSPTTYLEISGGSASSMFLSF